jgi:hypothetical protein
MIMMTMMMLQFKSGKHLMILAVMEDLPSHQLWTLWMVVSQKKMTLVVGYKSQ